MKFLRRIQSLSGLISVFLFCVEIICVLIQIISRNLIGKSYATIEELVIIILPYFALFAATYTMYNGNHVQIDYFYNKFPQSVRRIIFILLQIVMIVMIFVLIYGSFKLTVKQWKILSAALQWPNGIKYFCFVLCGPLMLPLYVYNIIKASHGELDDRQGLPEEEENNLLEENK